MIQATCTRSLTFEPRLRKTTMWFPNSSDTNQAVQAQKAGNFGFRKWRNCSIRVAKTNALISFAAYANCLFSNDAATFSNVLSYNRLMPGRSLSNRTHRHISCRQKWRRRYGSHRLQPRWTHRTDWGVYHWIHWGHR